MGVVLPAGFWLVMLVLNVVDAKDMDRAIYIGIGITILGLAMLVWRYVETSRLLSQGQEVVATVQRTWFFRDRARITCAYAYKGQKFQTSQSARLTRRVMSFKAGERVRVVVDKNKPQRFLIHQLFE